MRHTINPSAIGVVADIKGLTLSDQDYEFLQQPELSGLILFSRNYESPVQLTELASSIKAVRPDLLLCVDQEGGRVQRFRDGFTLLPAMLSLEPLYQQNKDEALALAQDLGWLMAAEVRQQGVHLSFAPVLDIDFGCSEVIGNRAFGKSAEVVIQLAGAFIEGMAEAGMAAVGKHYPGHGGVVADSHFDLPVDTRTLAELQEDIEPFRQLIAAQTLAGIMPAHVLYKAVDADNNAGFSSTWLQHILRQELGFDGVIFSDDLTMAAADIGSYEQRTEAAIAAGGNALLVCNDREAAQRVIEEVRRQQHAGLPHLDLQPMQGPKQVFNMNRLQRVRARLQEL